MDKEDLWTIRITIITMVYMIYIFLEGRDGTVDVPVAVLATGLWTAGMLETLYKAYKGSI